MEIIEAIVLGIIQGLAEWLPISSEGLTTLAMVNFFGKPFGQALAIAIWLHLGTLFSALFYFRKDIKPLVNDGIQIIKNIPAYNIHNKKRALAGFLIIATIITGIIGGIIYLVGLSKLSGTALTGSVVSGIIGLFLVITGIMMFAAKKAKMHKEVDAKDSFLLGFVQGFSILPGISRSGITTSFLLIKKYDGKQALRISFLMSIPAVIAAILGMILFQGFALGWSGLFAIFFAFVVGLLTIKYLMKLAERINFAYFCIIMGLLIIISALLL